MPMLLHTRVIIHYLLIRKIRSALITQGFSINFSIYFLFPTMHPNNTLFNIFGLHGHPQWSLDSFLIMQFTMLERRKTKKKCSNGIF